MKRFTSVFSLLTVAALAFSGCSGDDDDDDNKLGAAGTDGGGGEPNTGSPNLECDPDAATTCQNEQDCPFVANGAARAAAQTCGRGECLGSKEETCARECITRDLEMSGECATCYGDFVACTAGKCLADCFEDPNSEQCLTCQQDEGCRPAFNTCSGLPE